MERRKVTISIPDDLLQFADEVAQGSGESRSAVIAEALDFLRRAEREKALAQGYRFYIRTDEELAEEGLEATREALPDD